MLNDADDVEGWHRGRTARTRGLCMFQEHRIRTVERVPNVNGGRGFSNSSGFPGLGFSERVVTRTAGHTVNAVVVLYGLPLIAAGAILAHECTHAYIRLAGGYPRLEQKVEEGLCQLMALLWVENAALHGVSRERGGPSSGGGGKGGKVSAPAPASWEEANAAAMAGYVANQIRTDRSEIYGDGLRAALAAHNKHGLRAVFSHVRATGRLPPP